MSSTEDRYVFETEWFDQQACLVRNYRLTFYPKDGSIDMVSLTDGNLLTCVRAV